MNTHTLTSTVDAYSECQWNEEIKRGDILIIESEQVVGVADTWPVAVTEKHGEFHTPNEDIDLDGLVKDMNYNPYPDVNFKESFAKAGEVAKELGFDVAPFFETDSIFVNGIEYEINEYPLNNKTTIVTVEDDELVYEAVEDITGEYLEFYNAEGEFIERSPHIGNFENARDCIIWFLGTIHD